MSRRRSLAPSRRVKSRGFESRSGIRDVPLPCSRRQTCSTCFMPNPRRGPSRRSSPATWHAPGASRDAPARPGRVWCGFCEMSPSPAVAVEFAEPRADPRRSRHSTRRCRRGRTRSGQAQDGPVNRPVLKVRPALPLSVRDQDTTFEWRDVPVHAECPRCRGRGCVDVCGSPGSCGVELCWCGTGDRRRWRVYTRGGCGWSRARCFGSTAAIVGEFRGCIQTEEF